MSIIGGSVSYTRTVQPAPYESKSATVTLSFDTETDLDTAAALCTTKALAMVGIKSNVSPADADKLKAEFAAKTEAEAKEAAKVAAAAAAKAAAAEDKKKDPKAPKTPPKTPPKASVPAVPAADPAAIEDELVAGTGAEAEVADASVMGDEDELFGAVTEAVTDAALLGAITAHNGKVKNPIAIRTLIGKYVTPPKRANEIPADKRAAFLAELALIKPLV